MKKVLACIIIFHLVSTIAFAQNNKQIEIFDINKGKVIMNVQPNPDSQQEVKKFLEGITGVFVKYNPIPNKGFMIRVPLEPNIVVENQWFNDQVDEVTIFFSGQEEPYLMIFNDENRSFFFTFKGDTANFLNLIKFEPEASGLETDIYDEGLDVSGVSRTYHQKVGHLLRKSDIYSEKSDITQKNIA